MSKPSRQKKPPHKKAAPHDVHVVTRPQRQKQMHIFALVVIVILAGIPFSLGKYFEFNSPDPFDSGANVYSAKHILDGAEIGVEERHSANIGTLLINMLGVWLYEGITHKSGFSETGPKAMQMILQAAALCLMFIAMRRLFGTLAAAIAVIVASVYLSAPLIAKFGNDKMQYTIACMILGLSCFILYQLDGRWWLACLAGGFLSWAPLFKQTGVSAIGAVGLFVVLQPVLKNKTCKQTIVDILLLLAGGAVAIGPLYVWIIGWDIRMGLPYAFVWQTITKLLPVGNERAEGGVAYVAKSRKLVPFSQQWPIVLRYYGLLILPIALAAGAIIARIMRMIWAVVKAGKIKVKTYDRFVLLLAVLWLLDMAFVWISPRSYEQYYLSISASAAMLGGYLIAVYYDKAKSATHSQKWLVIGLLGLLAMIIMSWHIFFGIEKSPYSGKSYGGKQRGYAQRLNEISRRRKEELRGPWEVVGEYIHAHSEPTDKIYVWGWFPGIYIKAQRFSSASKAFCMPRPVPKELNELITTLLAEFENEMPKFIVDSRKRHIPTDRPPYELWPIVPKGFMGIEKPGFLPLDQNVIAAYDKAWSGMLRERFDEDEALRYEVLQPFREFVMKNYIIVQIFGQHVLFELKNPAVDKEPQ
jgi:hypothetical protein